MAEEGVEAINFTSIAEEELQGVPEHISEHIQTAMMDPQLKTTLALKNVNSDEIRLALQRIAPRAASAESVKSLRREMDGDVEAQGWGSGILEVIMIILDFASAAEDEKK